MLRTPAIVLTRIGNVADRNTMKTFEPLPIPNQMMISG